MRIGKSLFLAWFTAVYLFLPTSREVSYFSSHEESLSFPPFLEEHPPHGGGCVAVIKALRSCDPLKTGDKETQFLSKAGIAPIQDVSFSDQSLLFHAGAEQTTCY